MRAACMSPEQTLLTEFENLTKLSPLTVFGARVNASNFGVKRSSVGSNMPENALFGLVVVKCRRRHRPNRRRSGNHHIAL